MQFYRKKSSRWEGISRIGVWYLAFQCFMYILGFKILYQYYVLKLMSNQTIWQIVKNLLIYPIPESIFCLLYLYLFSKEVHDHTSQTTMQRDQSNNIKVTSLLLSIYIVNSIMGLIYSILFIFRNTRSRKKWRKFLSSLHLFSKNNNVS